jgi:DNA-directed RNA polymerase specialized sigma24 family protein
MIVSGFPPMIDAAYDDEFGKVDPEVYEVAKQIWAPAERLADEILHDSQKGMELMFKAIAKVSRVRAGNSAKIFNLHSYLYQSFKHLVLAELEKQNRRREKSDDWFRERESLSDETEEDEINKKILINELRIEMDEWTRAVFDLLRLGFSYEELVPHYGTAANVIRSKFSKKTARLAKAIQERIIAADEEIKLNV